MACPAPASKLLIRVLLLVSISEAVSVLQVSAADHLSKHEPQVMVQTSNADYDAFGLPANKLESLLSDKHSRQARILLSQTPRHENDGDARQMWLAACLCAEYKYDESITEFRKVKHLENAKGYVLYLAAMAYAQAQDFAKAKELSSIALKRDSCYPCYETRATCYNAEKRYAEAAADYEKAATYSKNHACDLYCEAAQCLLKANQPAKALALVDKGAPLENASSHGSSLLAKGTCLEKLGRYSEAIAVLSKGIRPKPIGVASTSNFWLSSCLTERAICYEKLGRKAEAAADHKSLDNMSSGLANDLLGK
jgi:tetratricopeptide (TPR) repeat protein